MTKKLDPSLHQRRHQKRIRNSAYREEHERARREIDRMDAIMRTLESRRLEIGVSKAELARRINKDPAEVRRLLGSGSINPQLITVLQLALELGLDLRLHATDV